MKTTKIVKLGAYRVSRKGSRIVVSRKVRDYSMAETRVLVRDRLEVAFSREKALELLALPKKLKAEKRKQKALRAKIRVLVRHLDKMESRSFSHRCFSIKLTRNGTFRFGCTRVPAVKLRAIKQLLK